MEVDVPVHAAAERLVLGLPAAAEGVVLPGRPFGPGLVVPLPVAQRDAAGDPVRAVLGDLDGRLPGAAVVDLGPGLLAVDGEAQGPRRAVPDGADDLIHPPTARVTNGSLAGMEDRRQAVGAVAGVLADPTVVEDGDLLADIGVPSVGNPVGALGGAEPDPGMAPVAERFHRGGTAAAEGHLRAWSGSPRRASRSGGPHW